MQIKILQNKIIVQSQKEELLKKYNCEYMDLDSVALKYIYLLSKDTDDNSEEHTCIELNKILQNESQLKPFDTTKVNVLNWPITPTN
jgi:hypothetical protein